MNGPSALATRSRDLLFCFRWRLHALFPFDRDSSVGEGYSSLASITENKECDSRDGSGSTGRKVPELSTTKRNTNQPHSLQCEIKLFLPESLYIPDFSPFCPFPDP
jgi:hypothetical protein